MRKIMFSKLCLVSKVEQSAFQIDFSSGPNVLVAGNGFGKSAILKSLFETLGAKPHKIDARWKAAQVISLLEFDLDSASFAALKLGDTYTLFGEDGAKLFTSNRVMELAEYLAPLFNFHLVLTDKQEQIRVPPPSYAFAPFYIDQDRGWLKPWDSFSDLAMFARSAHTLSEFHSGLRPNEFYTAQAERDKAIAELNVLDAERRAVHAALTKVRESMPASGLSLTVEEFKDEIVRLISESQALHDRQVSFRNQIAAQNEERVLWQDHVDIVSAAFKELDESFDDVAGEAHDVECPMCGQHYQNDIADQFALKADSEDLITALQSGRNHLARLDSTIANLKEQMGTLRGSADRVQQTLAIRRQDISLREIVQVEGRAEAQNILRGQLAALDVQCADKQRIVDECTIRMKEVDDKQRRGIITDEFRLAMQRFSIQLDVQLPPGRLSIQGGNVGRGSVTPRALAAYYYAFLKVASDHSTSVFCPIVVDAPNQQGQDAEHLPKLMNFLIQNAPDASQVIMASETTGGVSAAIVSDISNAKNQVLRKDMYDATLAYMQPFINRLAEA